MKFDVLSSSLNPFRSHFLEASAGTGKTFAIEHIVARLIIEGKESFLLEEILVVTFTKAATRELKFRIQKNLKKIHAELLSSESTIDYVRAIQEKGETKEAIARVEQALLSYENAPIYTLHGFCFRLLQEFGMQAKVSGLVNDPDKTPVQRALQEWIETRLKQEETLLQYSPVQIQKMLKANRRSPRKWVLALAKYVWGAQRIERGPSFEALLNQFQQELSSFPVMEREKVESDLLALSSCYTKLPKEGLDKLISLWGKIVGSKQCSYEDFDALLASDVLLERMQPQHKKKRAVSLDLYYPTLLSAMQRAFFSLIEQGKDPSLLLLNLSYDLRKESQSHFQEGDLFLPDELLEKVHSALAYPEFVARVQKKFKAAIIDEFQDTDPLQWEIVKKLFSGSVLYLVGDPKQSIYAFRNADVYVYLDAKHQMGSDVRCELTTNFRSSSSLVQALNTLFSRVSSRWMALPSQEEVLNVSSVESGSSILPLNSPAMTWFYSQDKKGRKFPSTSLMEKKVHPYIASEILSLHREEKIPFQEMAILVKDRFQGQEVVEHLRECNIPAHLQRGSLLTETEAYFSLKEVMQAVYSPQSVRKIKTALATPLLGWTSSLLSQESASPHFLQVKAQFHILQSILFSRGFAPFFHELISMQWTLEAREIDGDLLKDLRRFLEIIIQEEEEGINYLECLEKLAFRAESDDPVLQNSSSEEVGSVRVMTIHRSKGLEFTVVFALGLASRHPVPDLISLRKENLLTPFRETDERCRKMVEEIDAEKMRLFYVALTRAKQKLYIPLLLEEREEPLAPGEGSCVELFCSHLAPFNQILPVLQEFSCVHVLEEQSLPFYEDPVQSVSNKESVPPLCFKKRAVVSFSSLAEKKEMAASVPLVCDFSIQSMPKGSETGVLLHRLFEQILKKGIHNPIESIVVKELFRTPLAPWISEITPWIYRLFQKPLCGFCLAEVPLSQMQYEMEFLYPCKEGLMKGFADLFFLYDDKYYLLDWKSNVLSDYSQESMQECVKEHEYDLQASIYKEALQRYVKLFDNRPFSACFGGAIYYFVRGESAYHFFPEDL